MLENLRRLLEMIRFSHTLFALPFAFLSAALAWHFKGSFQILEMIGILLCMVFARSTAMAFNRLADRDVDAGNPRTAGRHLVTGELKVAQVRAFAVLSGLGFILSTLVFLLSTPSNPWPLYLSGPVLAFICAYSYTKRFTPWTHFWLGTSLFLAPVAAWIAVRGLEDLGIPLMLGLAVLFWVAGFDIIYSCQDVDFDRRARLQSVPAWMGVGPALRLALVCHLLMVGFLVGLYFQAAPPLGTFYLGGVAAVLALLIYEHALVRPTDLSRVNQAFFHVNAIISVGLFLIVLMEIALAG